MDFLPRPIADLDLEFPPELDHVSASGIKMMVRCEEQWRQRYILGRKEPPALAMLAGRADHAAIELNMLQKVESATDLPVGEVREEYVRELEAAVEQSGGLGEVIIRDADTPQARQRSYDKVRSNGQDVVAVYHNQVSRTLQPLEVESVFNINVPGLPVVMNGRIDLVAHNVRDEANPFIIDRKRRSRASKKIEPEWSLQAEVYQLARPLPFRFDISVATDRPSVIVDEPELLLPLAPRERSERLVAQLVAKIGFLYRKYGPDEPWPTTGKLHPWACGYCGFREHCWGWQ